MTSLRNWIVLAILPCMMIVCSLTAAEEKTMTQVPSAQLEASATASQTWLDKVDKGHYGEAWDTGSSLFKLTINKEDWDRFMNKTRKPLGSVVSRQVIDQRVANNPKGLPAGEYFVMVYKTSFANKPNTNELVTLTMMDGQWRVLTYTVP